MVEALKTIVLSSNSDSSSNNLSYGSDSNVYLSNVKSNTTLLSGIFPFSSRFKSLSFENGISDCSKICRYCLSDDDTSDWLAPCKCIGTMRWVHLSCFEQWLSVAPHSMKYNCAICSFVYRRRWRLKPYKHWHWPRFRLRLTDLFGIYFDIILTYRVCRYFPRCMDNRVPFFFYLSYVFLWKLVVFNRVRLNFYSNIAYDIFTSIFSSTLLDAS